MSRRYNWKALLSLLLSLVLLCGCIPALAEEAVEEQTTAATEPLPEGYALAAENSRFNLYLKDETLSIIVESKRTGKRLYSTVQNPDDYKDNDTWKGFYQSGVVMEYLLDVQARTSQADFINTASEITYDRRDDGFTAHVTYTDLGISYDLVLTMNEAGFEARIPQDSIVETHEQPYIICEENGEDVRIDLQKYAKTSDSTVYTLVAADGSTYTVPTTSYVSVAGEQVTVRNLDGKAQAAVPLGEGETSEVSILVTDNKTGKNVEVRADSIQSMSRQVYLTGTKLDGSDLKVEREKVKEIYDVSYTTASFYLFPFLGHTVLGEEEGYMIIPDGQGAIINLENNEGRFTSPFDRQVYGTNLGVDDVVNSGTYVNSEDIIMPIYGMVHTADEIGFLGVIEEGDTAARIMAYPNGVRMSFNWVASKMTYRFVFNQPMGPSAGQVATRSEKRRNFDIVEQFLLEDGETASYAGLAVAYRNYLKDKGTFDNAEKRDFDVQLDFLGLERENFVLGKTDVVMTTFEQAGDILETLADKGVEGISALYRGWQTNGLTGGVPTDSYSPARSLGGDSGLQKLKERAAALNIPVTLEADLLSLNTETHVTLLYSAFKKITSQTYSKPTFGIVYDTLYYLNPEASKNIGETLIRELKDAKIENISFKGITELMADYYYKDHYHDTTELAEIYSGIIAAAREAGMETSLVNANAYLWPLASTLCDLPIGGSDYTYTDAEIPFLAIALSGQIPFYAEYVNFQANSEEFFLHLMEQGARPAFLLTWEDPIALQKTNSSGIYSSCYELYESLIVQWYTELNALWNTVGEDGMIVDHVRQGDMACVTWSNGTRVYLNFGDRTATMDDVTLEKLSYKVVSSNGEN